MDAWWNQRIKLCLVAPIALSDPRRNSWWLVVSHTQRLIDFHSKVQSNSGISLYIYDSSCTVLIATIRSYLQQTVTLTPNFSGSMHQKARPRNNGIKMWQVLNISYIGRDPIDRLVGALHSSTSKTNPISYNHKVRTWQLTRHPCKSSRDNRRYKSKPSGVSSWKISPSNECMW